MDKKTIIKLENYIFGVKKKHEATAEDMAGIIGVLIDLKPAMIGDFNEDEFKNLKIEEFEKLLKELELKVVYFENYVFVKDSKKIYVHFCISKKTRLAKQTKKAFIKLWSTMNDMGEVLNRKKWIKATKMIGKLLGYPKTAIIDFIKNDDIDDEDRVERMNRNRYYIHSAKNENEEFNLYDKRLNKAISDLAPKTTDILTENKEKRWLV